MIRQREKRQPSREHFHVPYDAGPQRREKRGIRSMINKHGVLLELQIDVMRERDFQFRLKPAVQQTSKGARGIQGSHFLHPASGLI